ncbi:MAG: DUF1648 domain-containing protein [Eubacterium sp.]|nr:DUF1648 domain-containing protein [Eubacterium sp.]
MMRKVSVVVAFVPLLVTIWVLQYLPDSVPMHYDLAGNIDRWGSRNESLVMPIIIIFVALMFSFIVKHYENVLMDETDEKKIKSILTNIKVINITSLVTAVGMGIIHLTSIYGAYARANEGGLLLEIEEGRASCISLGIIFFILGNYIPKTRMNYVIGVKTSWSMYNDNTWRKSNLIGGITFAIAGVLTIITGFVADASKSGILMVSYVMIASVISVIYSWKVYKDELRLKKGE